MPHLSGGRSIKNINQLRKGDKFMSNKNGESKLFTACVLLFSITFFLTFLAGGALAAGNPLDALQAQINALLTRITNLEAQVTALQNAQGEIEALEDRVNEIEENSVLKLNNFLTLDTDESGYERALFTGINVQIISGSGKTDAGTNGLGNLIVGYNESYYERPNDHSGSHNIITGIYNNYLSYGGLVIGFNNDISGKYSCVSGGAGNKATGDFSSVSGGMNNRAFGDYSSVSGGHTNTASGGTSSVSGGQKNTASGVTSSSVSGGFSNTADGVVSSVSGGQSNIASGQGSSVSGGQSNIASAIASSVSGGLEDEIKTSYSWRAGDLIEIE
jgi:hypothetical protein